MSLFGWGDAAPHEVVAQATYLRKAPLQVDLQRRWPWLPALGLVVVAGIAGVVWHRRRPTPAADEVPTVTVSREAMAAVGADPEVRIGQTVGGYRLDALLGQGGMATVYRGEPLNGGPPAAVKLIRVDPTGPPDEIERERKRLVREQRVLLRLDHPHIMKVLECGDEGGQPYLVSELLEGRTLRSVLRSGPLTEATARRWFKQMLEGMVYAHGQGVVHRDLKPENIMVLPDDSIKIMDFGLARATDLTTVTATGEICGTVRYMAPERFSGLPDNPSSDQYALGIILYEMLVGDVPFDGGQTEIMFLVLNTPLTPLSKTLPGVHPELEAFVDRLTRKMRTQRFDTLEAALAAFNELSPATTSGESHHARP